MVKSWRIVNQSSSEGPPVRLWPLALHTHRPSVLEGRGGGGESVGDAAAVAQLSDAGLQRRSVVTGSNLLLPVTFVFKRCQWFTDTVF